MSDVPSTPFGNPITFIGTDPPPPGTWHKDPMWLETLEVLASRPGEWADLGDHGSLIAHRRSGIQSTAKARYPDRKLEVAQRSGKLYARFVQ
jgi:hypothetical protein